MQHHNVMAGLDDGHVKLRIQLALFFCLSIRMRRFHAGTDRVHNLQIRVGCNPYGPLNRERLHIAAKGQVIVDGFVMPGHQILQGWRKSRPENIADKHACAGLGRQQPGSLKLCNGVSERGARDRHAVGKLPFGGQPFAGAQNAAQDQFLYLPHNGRRQFLGRDRAKWHRKGAFCKIGKNI